MDSGLKNIKTDIDTSTNTDGEDLAVYLNDFIEITVSERSIFFDLVLANPFEYGLLFSATLVLSYLLLNDILYCQYIYQNFFRFILINFFKILDKIFDKFTTKFIIDYYLFLCK